MKGFKDSTRMKYMNDRELVEKAARKLDPKGSVMAGEIKPLYRDREMVGKAARKLDPKGSVMVGGTFNERGKRATMAEIAAEDRRMANRKPPVEGVSSRPTDSSGRRATDADLGMTAKKPVVKGGAMAGAAAGALAGAAARAAAKAAPRGMGAMSDREMQMLKAAAAKKGVPAHSDRPMIRRKAGVLASMPKGKC